MTEASNTATSGSVGASAAQSLPGDKPLGAIPFTGGTTFRVWAPNATSVDVLLIDGTGTTTAVAPLASVGDGVWSADLAGVGPGDAYRYSIRSADPKAGPDPLDRIDPYATDVTSSAGVARVYDESEFRWSGLEFQPPPVNDLVIYELHVGTFNRPEPGVVGTLADAAARIPYLQDLGINAIELLPVAEFAGDISGGYDPALPFSVEAAYGGPDALKAFVARAHEAGMAVILDVVYNHFGPDDLKYSLWRFDGWFADNPEGDPRGGIYFYADDRAATPWGSRPDYGRPQIRRYIRDNVRLWLDTYRVDGLRLDSTGNIRSVDGRGGRELADGRTVLQQINEVAESLPRPTVRIAEDMCDYDWITDPAGQGAGFTAQWDPGFVRTLRAAVVTDRDEERDMNAVAWALQRRYSGRPFARVIYVENHDEDSNGQKRLPPTITPADPAGFYAKKRSTLAAAALFTGAGIPMIFMGQEFLEPGWWAVDVALDWAEATEFAGIRRLYRDLIACRRNLGNVTGGLAGDGIQVHHINNGDKVLAFHRWSTGGPGDDTVVILNFGYRAYDSYTIGLPADGLWQVRFNSDASVYDSSFGNHPSDTTTAERTGRDGLPFAGSVGIGGYTALILSQAGL